MIMIIQCKSANKSNTSWYKNSESHCTYGDSGTVFFFIYEVHKLWASLEKLALNWILKGVGGVRSPQIATWSVGTLTTALCMWVMCCCPCSHCICCLVHQLTKRRHFVFNDTKLHTIYLLSYGKSYIIYLTILNHTDILLYINIHEEHSSHLRRVLFLDNNFPNTSAPVDLRLFPCDHQHTCLITHKT